jgi:hypothetical protein
MTITSRSIVSHVGMRFAGWVIACALCAYVMYRMAQMAMNEFTCFGDAPQKCRTGFRATVNIDRRSSQGRAAGITVASTAFVWTRRLLALSRSYGRLHRPNAVLTVSIGPKSSRAVSRAPEGLPPLNGGLYVRHQVHVSSAAVYGSTWCSKSPNDTLWRPRLSPCTRGKPRSDRRGR